MKKNGLVILPFLALLVLAISQSISSAYVGLTWLPYVGYVLAAVCVGAWVYGDLDHFKHFFSRKGFRYGASSGLLVVMVITALAGIAYVTSRDTLNKKWDITKNKVSSLDSSSVEVAQKLKEGDITVQAQGFFSSPDELTLFKRLVGLYILHGAPIVVEYIDPGQNPEQVIAAQIKSENTVIFSVGDRTSRITSFEEEEITNVLLNLLKTGSKKVYFTKGHGEGGLDSQEENGFSVARDVLDDQKIEVLDLSLLELGMVPPDADLLVVAGPRYDFQASEVALLEEYLKGGGAVFMAVGSVVNLPEVKSFMGKYGVALGQDLLLLNPQDPRARMVGLEHAFITDFDDMSGITKKFSKRSGVATQMLWRMSRSVSLLKDKEGEEKKEESGYRTSMVIKTAPHVGRVVDVTSPKDLQPLSQERYRLDGPYGVMAVSILDKPASAEEGKEDNEEDSTEEEATRGGTLVVAGSSDFMNNRGLTMGQAHRELLGSLVSYLIRDENFVSIPNKKYDSGNLELSSSGAQYSLIFLFWIYPALFFGASLLYWLFRRRKAA